MTTDEKKEVRSLVAWWLAQVWPGLRDARRWAYTKKAIWLVRGF